jgi:hypothetical protein
MFQKKEKIHKTGRKKIILFFLVFCFITSFITSFFVFNKSAFALGEGSFASQIQVKSIEELRAVEQQTAKEEKNWLEKLLTDAKKWAWEKGGSVAFWLALRGALNTIAYDTATWIGSGGKGQKPMFITEGWGEYLTNIADNAAGYFIEGINEEYGVNLCEPSLGVKTKIGLGLVQYVRPEKPDCTFSEMRNNWENELQRPDFLSRFQNMFEPTSSDLGIALSLHTRLIEQQNYEILSETKDREENQGWLDISGIAGTRENPPGHARSKLEQAKRIREASFAENTEDAFEDAANIFLNQLAVTLFNRLLESLGKGIKYTSPYSGDYGGLGDYEAGPVSGGVTAATEKFRKLVEPDFTVRGDYDILAELTQCPDPTKAGPTNCVITDNFREAVANKMTVGEAMKQGYLNANGVFGFTADGLEPKYNEGYPYRSMIILRKFRIIPVGWEVAAQYIKDRPNDIDGTKNLEDLISCFDQNDEYEGYYSSWCDGLVDPTWVLKAPLNYCKREGPGPEIISEQVTGEGDDSELSISRNDNYCGDEQSCIKEYDEVSCQLYVYCTEEIRKWAFNGSSCEPKYNTCQTFRARDGQTVSYLENTLDYSNCSVDKVG